MIDKVMVNFVLKENKTTLNVQSQCLGLIHTNISPFGNKINMFLWQFSE